MVTRRPRDFRINPIDAAAIPFPRDEITPPVMNMYFTLFRAKGSIPIVERECLKLQSHPTVQASIRPLPTCLILVHLHAVQVLAFQMWGWEDSGCRRSQFRLPQHLLQSRL